MRIPRPWRRSVSTAPAVGAVPAAGSVPTVHLDAAQLNELSAVFSAPRWLRDLGFASWLLLGVAALGFSLILLLDATSVIVAPVVAAFVVATVASPVVAVIQRRGVPRAAGAVVALLSIAALGVLILVLVVGGIVSQAGQISSESSAAATKLQGWLQDAGVSQSGASDATSSLRTDLPNVISTFVSGITRGIEGLTSLAFAVSFTLFSLFFLLKDGPVMRRWVEHRMGVPHPIARTITGGVMQSLRRYFGGVTIVAAFNGIVVGIGALALGVPLAGTIAVVTFVTAYIPFIGAFVAGAFAVILALGSQGTNTALIMLVIVILANGMLQNIVQPIAFGATLRLNPLVVLVVTIAAGSLFGMIGLVLAAPLTSAVVHISGELAHARSAETDAPPPAGKPPAA
jgi:predicted PurR-regulated permease PerM